MGTTQRIANFIAKTRFEDIPAPAVDLAKLCLLDAVGCGIYSSTLPLGKIFASFIEEQGGKPVARVLGTGIETNSINAAMVNGALIHADEFDDLGGHHASILTPIALALGDEYRLDGKLTLLSYIIGFEVSRNIMHAIGEDHYGRGWHNPSSIGTLGTTAAAARMMGLDEMQTRMALGIGASQCSGIRANFGTMTKPFHPGIAGRNGITAAKMAQKGYEACPDVMEHRYGYAAVFGDEMMSLPAVTRHLGHAWALMGGGKGHASGSHIKVWPCCGATHGVITAAIGIASKHKPKPADIASIDVVTTHNPSTVAANIRWPKDELERKFSPWFCAASAVVDGRIDLASFGDKAALRPEVQELLKRSTVTQDRDHIGRPHRARGGGTWWDVSVTLKNGERLEWPRVTAAGGHGKVYGWESREAVFDKFKMLAGVKLSASQADAALNALMDLDKASDVRKVFDTLFVAR